MLSISRCCGGYWWWGYSDIRHDRNIRRGISGKSRYLSRYSRNGGCNIQLPRSSGGRYFLRKGLVAMVFRRSSSHFSENRQNAHTTISISTFHSRVPQYLSLHLFSHSNRSRGTLRSSKQLWGVIFSLIWLFQESSEGLRSLETLKNSLLPQISLQEEILTPHCYRLKKVDYSGCVLMFASATLILVPLSW